LRVSEKSLGTVEHCTILAGRILANGSENYWNQNIPKVKDHEPLYNLNGLTKAFLGCLIRRQLVANFHEQTKEKSGEFYESNELLNVYQNFDSEQRDTFNTHHSITKSQSQQDASLTEKVAALTEQNALLTNALHEIRTTGERQGNCEHDAALAEKVAILSAQNTSLTGYVATFANALHEIRTTRKR